MPGYTYYQLDVFARSKGGGNPLVGKELRAMDVEAEVAKAPGKQQARRVHELRNALHPREIAEEAEDDRIPGLARAPARRQTI